MAWLVSFERPHETSKPCPMSEFLQQINHYLAEGSAIAGAAVAVHGQRVVVVWAQGERLGQVESRDRGVCFSESRWIHHDSRPLAGPSLALSSDGDLHLLFQADVVQLCRSSDGGATWSGPATAILPEASFTFSNQRLLITDGGRWLLSVVDGQGQAGLLVSDDSGRRWLRCGQVVRDPQSRRCGIPALYHRPGGVGMVVAMHGLEQVYTFHSEDGGEHWSLFDNYAPPARAEFPFALAAGSRRDQHFMLWHNHSIATNLTCCRRREGERFWDCFHALEPQDRWPDPCLWTEPAMVIDDTFAHVIYVERQTQEPDRLIHRRLPLSLLTTRAPQRAGVNDCEAFIRRALQDKRMDAPALRDLVTTAFNPAVVPQGDPR
jgi:hypothetical protein